MDLYRLGWSWGGKRLIFPVKKMAVERGRGGGNEMSGRRRRISGKERGDEERGLHLSFLSVADWWRAGRGGPRS